MTAKPSHRKSLQPLALLAAGISGADVERLVRELRAKGRRRDDPGRPVITWVDLERALLAGKNVPSSGMARRIAVHEVGHAIAYEALGIADVIHVRVGGERGGETRTKMRIETIQTEEGMMHWIACLLAGQAAEKLVYGTALLGAGGSNDSDLARATSIAVDLETGYGVAADMSLLYRTPVNVSETLLYNPVLSDRVHRRLQAAQAVAQALLKERHAVLENLAEKLTSEIVMDGDKFRSALTAMPPP
jgi:ATP-dependent Zn protease